ncbi:MAG: siroheme synthase CysG [Pseudomonadota bacterium]|uniref:siroheme synthase CysG n=1 Tax=Gallaecimonas pentaromativorans TaxID=584787 RepID=UPI00067E9CE0|nr:siroheme synthase CysG [Gallaecimonas pentaromativorans]MED5523331.1 siroheme synthase CysG [Pseudomonadota bacterium]
MHDFPLFLDLHGKDVLVVGGGTVAWRKVQALHKAGAKVRLVAKTLCAEIAASPVDHVAEQFEPKWLDGVWLAIAATDDELVNEAVAEAANARQIWVNVVDQRTLCSAIVPAVVERKPVTIAISSDGQAPVLARRLREKLEAEVPQWTGALAALMGRFRDKVASRFAAFSDRRRFWEALLDGDTGQQLAKGDTQAAEAELEALLAGENRRSGWLKLVGAGPGDPDLLTLKALQAIQAADVIVYDRLVSDAVMNLARRDADFISVGKEKGLHSVPQPEIEAILVREASAGKRVVRLKGGDPFVFGRGGEEVLAARAAGIEVDVVPGITAAAACSARTQVPLTHRGLANQMTLVTGHCQPGGEDANWRALAQPKSTLAIYMGLTQSSHIADELMAGGLAASTPVLVVENGTRPEERRFRTDLGHLADTVEQAQVKSPALLMIGDTVTLYQEAK